MCQNYRICMTFCSYCIWLFQEAVLIKPSLDHIQNLIRLDLLRPFFTYFVLLFFSLQALSVFSATLCARRAACTNGTFRSTWSRGCLSATFATSSWRRPSSCWSTRSATPSPPEGSSKESKYRHRFHQSFLSIVVPIHHIQKPPEIQIYNWDVPAELFNLYLI